MPDQTYFDAAAERIAKTSFVRVKPDFQTKRVDTKWLGFLVLESLRKYASRPETFGKKPSSFNKAMEPLLTQICKNRTRRSNLSKLIEAYERGPRSRVRKYIGRTKVTRYLARKGEVPFLNCTRDMFLNRLIPYAVTLKDEPSIDDRQCRRIYAVLTNVHCHENSEWTADEPYLITGASLSDFTGTWEKETECSNYAGSVDPGDDINFSPPSIKKLFDWRIENPSDDLSLWPVTALCTITLMEHDQGDKERAYHAFRAAYSIANLLVGIATGATGGPVGVAIAIVSILVSVLLSLDGEDELGTVGLRFDNVLGGSSPAPQDLKQVIEGKHKGNYYKYEFSIQYTGDDYDCPVGVPFWITGADKRTIPYAGGTTHGGYAIVCPSPLHQIVWSVSPPYAIINQQGKRYTRIQWHTPGIYTVSATAKEQSGIQTHYSEMKVNVEEDRTTIPP